MPEISSPHHTTHEDGGNDEIDLTGLSGAYNLDDLKTDHPTLTGTELHNPKAHASSHASDGSDAIDSPSSYNVFKTTDVYNSIIAGTWAFVISGSNWLNGDFRNTSQALNDEIQYKFSHKKGSFTFVLIAWQAISGGIITVSIDGVSLGTIDLYAAVSIRNLRFTLPATIATDGVHTLNIKVTDKNASSSSYYALLQSWYITD